MKKNLNTSIIILSFLLLSACSLNEDAATLYKQEIPLESEIIIPESISTNKDENIKIVLTQGGKKVIDADFVHYEIWKQDGSVQFPMEEAKNEKDGTYRLIKNFHQEGLYYIKLHAGNDGSIIIPQKLFVVGELSENEKDFLKKNGSQKKENKHEGHH